MKCYAKTYVCKEENFIQSCGEIQLFLWYVNPLHIPFVLFFLLNYNFYCDMAAILPRTQFDKSEKNFLSVWQKR